VDYYAVKSLHVSAVVLSYALFFLRGVWMLQGSPRLGARWVRTVPHVVDSVLLAAAVVLVLMLREYPFGTGWLTAKTIWLVVYIGLGTVALRRGRSKRVRLRAWIAAQAVFVYIVSVALTKNPFVLF
jgi:uncharacterized membrane protein SirB2